MDLDISSQTSFSTQSITDKCTNKSRIFESISNEIKSLSELPVDALDNKLSNILPRMNSLLLEIYKENVSINSRDELEKLRGNLMISISLNDGLKDILEQTSQHLEDYDILILKSLFLWLPISFDITYRHCKENQKHYQDVMNDCKEIMELYKRNQECYMRFLNNLQFIKVDCRNSDSVDVFLKAIQYLSKVISSLFEMLNIKALADSWKGYCGVVEKHYEIFSTRGVCISAIEMLILQIDSFMDKALENRDDKQRIQYIKLSGFLVKVLMKIIRLFWEKLQVQYLKTIHKMLCTIYNYSMEFLGKWDLKSEIKSNIQTCLFDVVTPFLSEKILSESFLKQLYINSELKERSEGCLAIDLKILDFLRSQPTEIDYICFEVILKHLFEDVALFTSKVSHDSTNLENSMFRNLCDMITECVGVHAELYNENTERILIENVIGDNFNCHFLATEVWIRILRWATKDSKEKTAKRLFESINQLQIDISFVSQKVILLKNFTQRVFNLLDDDGKVMFLEMYPPHTHIHLWRFVGFCNLNLRHKMFIEPLLHSLLENMDNFENVQSGLDIIETLEVLKLISVLDAPLLQSDSSKLLKSLMNLWEYNYEVVDVSNVLLRFLISRLCQVTINLMNVISSAQLIDVLKKMKSLSTTASFKIQLCCLLDALSTRKSEHNIEQNKLNSIVSDLFEILLTDDNKVLKELSLETFQRFVNNNHFIIVNNVCRMLPNMNLKQSPDTRLDKIELGEYFSRMETTTLQHKCLRKISICNENQFVRSHSFPSNQTDNVLEPLQPNNKKTCLGIRSNRMLQNQNKRIKLTDDLEEDDTIKDIILRIKSEIKCLNKVLLKDRMTPKNKQDMRLLINQLQNTMES